jgi:uncharacterized protein (TIGR02231 family)
MKYFALGALALAMSAPPLMAAAAAELETTSTIDNVVVFPSGAEVNRTAKVSLPAGETTIVFPDLPAQTVAGSIRVEGEADGTLRIGSVDQRRLFVPQSGSGNKVSERKRLEKEIEGLKDKRKMIDGRIETVKTQQMLLQNLANLPNVSPGRDGNAGPGPDWGQIVSLIGNEMGEIQETLHESEIEIRDLNRKIEDLEKKLSELAPKRIERTQVKVFVSTDAALEADLKIKYQVRSASWSPSYEARLKTEAADAKSKLQLVRRATIQQRSGEPWKNVAIKLSTTRPASGSTAPELRPMVVDIMKPRPEPAPGVGGVMSMDSASEAPAQERSKYLRSRNNMVAKARRSAAKPVMATVETAPFQAIFAVPGLADIDSTGEAKNLMISEADFDVSLSVKAVPKKQPTAYLYATLERTSETPLLPGPVALFRDGTFVGKGRLPLIAGERYELGFGADDLVRVKHAIVQEKRGETGLISTTRTDDRNYKLTITNLHQQKIDVTVLDQMPVARDEQIQVALTGRSRPTKRDVDDKRGLLAWEFELKPKEEKIIDFGYVVKWPADKQIIYRAQ